MNFIYVRYLSISFWKVEGDHPKAMEELAHSREEAAQLSVRSLGFFFYGR